MTVLDGPKILAAYQWASNAELIADCARLGYLNLTDRVLDPTYEKGTWWKLWRPDELVTYNRERDGSDFRSLPDPDGSFDAIAYDPPFVCPGGLHTSTVKAMHARYGMASETAGARDFKTPAELQQLMNDGLTEMRRLVKSGRRRGDGGLVLMKCKDYVWGGRLWLGTHETLTHALALGFELVDRFEHVGTPGPQSQTRQVHARRNLSTLFVLRKCAQ